jgi:hypothetical protein
LKNTNTRKYFQLDLQNRLRILQEEQELTIDSFNQVLTETSKKGLGYRRKQKEEWIKSDMWTTDERKATKKKLTDAKSQ